MVRGGKVEQRSGSLLNSLPAMEFCAMIRGNRFNLQGLPADEFNGSVFGGLLGFVGQFAYFQVARFAFDQRQQVAAAFGSFNQINFPVANPFFLVDNIR
jgi:hypothetical protein